jgi:hypothetical protein
MSRYLARLKALIAEDAPTRPTAETDKSSCVSFVSDQGSPLCDDESAIEERAALAADSVPACYLDAWARLNHQKPFCVAEAEWRLALDDGGRFLDAWGSEAAELGWTPGELFDVEAGLVWRLSGQRVKAFAWDHVWLQDGRIIFRRELKGFR